MSEAYPNIIKDILQNGIKTSPRGSLITEVCGYGFKLYSYSQPTPLQKSRKLNFRFGILEGLCNILGEYPTDLILGTNKNMKTFMNEETGTWTGAYAPRMQYPLVEIFKTLQDDNDSRQAILPVFSLADTERLNVKGEWKKDIPCTQGLQFLIRDGKLNMIATMRSNDVCWGLPYDVTQFAMIGMALASWLEIPTGWYVHNAGSMHIYDSTKDILESIVNNNEEEFANFEHPSWPSSDILKTRDQIDVVFRSYRKFLRTGEIEELHLSLPEHMNTYHEYLTKQKKIIYV